MKKNILIFKILITVLFLTSCSEDFLEPKPLSFYAPENTLVNAEALDASLVSCLKNIRGEFYGDAAPIITEYIFSEVAVEGTTDKAGPAMNLPAQILPDENLNHAARNRIGWYWNEAFNKIKYANTVISRIDNAEFSSENEKNHILGKAYFHRARTYYMLTQQFGDVPLILEEIREPKLDFYTVTRKSILEKIKKDLEFAAQWVKPESETGIVGDVTKAAVNHLLTKVNLANGNFDDAIASSSAIINDGYHYLMTERFGIDKNDPTKDIIWDLHQAQNKALDENREKIFLLMSREDMLDPGASEILSIARQCVPFWEFTGIKTPSGINGTTSQPLGHNVGGVPVEIDQVTQYGRGIGRCRQTPYHHTFIWTDQNDMRHNESNWREMEDLVYNNPVLKRDGDPWYGKKLRLYDENGNILCSDTIRAWYGWPYYKIHVDHPDNPRPQGGRADWYLYRLSETYLLRAEAYFWKEQLQEAANDINAVRTRAGCAPYSASDINIGTILDERARELFYEEPRKTELTRIAFIFAQTGKTCYNGKTYNEQNFSENNFWYDRIMEKNDFYRKEVQGPHQTYRAAPWLGLWPIPAPTINANTKGHINQNKGYPGSSTNITPWKWVDGEGEGEIIQQ